MQINANIAQDKYHHQMRYGTAGLASVRDDSEAVRRVDGRLLLFQMTGTANCELLVSSVVLDMTVSRCEKTADIVCL